MAYGTRAGFNAVREEVFGNVSANYSAVGTALTDHARIIIFTNTLDVEVYFSLDGTTDQLRLPANGFRLLDFTTNRVKDDGLFVSVGTIFYVKRVSGAPASGSVWIEVVSATAGGV